jgi:hypothetical protein
MYTYLNLYLYNGGSRETTVLQAQVEHALGYFQTTANNPTQPLKQVQQYALLLNLLLLLLLLLLLPIAFCCMFRPF